MAMVQKTSLELTDRLSVEAQFFDHLKEDEGWRLARFYEWGLYRDAVDHSRISLGEIKGKQLLEFGCGLGNDTVFFAQQGAEVITFDVSESMLQRVAELIREKDLDQFVCLYHMSGED